MTIDGIAAFMSCVKKCGKSVYPSSWDAEGFEESLSRPEEFLGYSRAINAGIVGLQWYLEQNAIGFQSINEMYVVVPEKCFTSKVFTEKHDGTLEGKFIALCKLAENITP